MLDLWVSPLLFFVSGLLLFFLTKSYSVALFLLFIFKSVSFQFEQLFESEGWGLSEGLQNLNVKSISHALKVKALE